MRDFNPIPNGAQPGSPLPIYWRVYSVLREEIVDRAYSPDEPLPSEGAIAERFATSRITIRKAIAMLRSEGYLFTRRGIGTFVSPQLPPESAPASFTANLSDMWRQTKTELLEYGMIAAPAEVASLLQLERGAEVHKAVRLRSYKKRPIGLLTTYIRKSVAEGFTPERFISAPLFQLFAQVGVPTTKARQRISARSADPFASQHLDVEIGAPLLCVMRVSFAADGRQISYLRGMFRPDRYEIELDLEVNSMSQTAVWQVLGGVTPPQTALYDLDPKDG